MKPVITSIILWESRERFDDMEIVEVYDGERDEKRNLQGEGGVLFRTNGRKNWFIKFSEFSFVFPATANA